MTAPTRANAATMATMLSRWAMTMGLSFGCVDVRLVNEPLNASTSARAGKHFIRCTATEAKIFKYYKSNTLVD
jgi:hypothetical protein